MFNKIRTYLKVRKIIKKSCDEEQLLIKLGDTMGLKFKIDRLGRIYAIINPLIKNINDGGNTLIYGGDSTPMIDNFLMKNLEIIQHFIGANQFFDILTYNIKKIDDDENYLITLEPIFLRNLLKKLKVFSYIIIGLIILTTTYFIIK